MIVVVLVVFLLAVLGASVEEGTYRLVHCEYDAPCCLKGYVGVASSATLSFNLATFDARCLRMLPIDGFDVRFGQLKHYNTSHQATHFAIRLPNLHKQVFRLTLSHRTLHLHNLGVGLKVFASSWGAYMSSLEFGIQNGTIRDPHKPQDHQASDDVDIDIPDPQGYAFWTWAIVLPLFVVFATIIYVFLRRRGILQPVKVCSRCSLSRVCFCCKFQSGDRPEKDDDSFRWISTTSSVLAVSPSPTPISSSSPMRDMDSGPGSGSPSKLRRPKPWLLFNNNSDPSAQQADGPGVLSFKQMSSEASVIGSPKKQRRNSQLSKRVLGSKSAEDDANDAIVVSLTEMRGEMV